MAVVSCWLKGTMRRETEVETSTPFWESALLWLCGSRSSEMRPSSAI
jgi:hypothetical protein